MASALSAQYSSREALCKTNMTLREAYQKLFQCRRDAYLGLDYGIPELMGYFRELFNRINNLPLAESVNAWVQTVPKLLGKDVDEILTDTADLISETRRGHISARSHFGYGPKSFDHGFQAAQDYPGMFDIASALCGN